jgi:hypothetical protein
VFGVIESVMGFRQFMLRGREKVRNEWTLVCLAWNLKRMAILRLRQGNRARALGFHAETLGLCPETVQFVLDREINLAGNFKSDRLLGPPTRIQRLGNL